MFLIWAGFILLVLAMLALDLGIFHRKDHVIGIRESLIWTGIWILLSLAFSVFIYFGYEHQWLGMGTVPDSVEQTAGARHGFVHTGKSAVIKYLTGYIVEKSLSVDNIFVMAVLFGFFAVPAIYQHRVLFWGILGALVMRGTMIAIGATLIARFSWILYVFGAFLLITAIKMLVIKGESTTPGSNFVVKFARRVFPVTERFHGHYFVVKAGSRKSHQPALAGASAAEIDSAVEAAPTGALMLTPLALALVMIECTDLIFAVDSIPAVFAITADPFLVFTSNVFAILGLRSLYFALGGMMEIFKHLKFSLAIVLALVGGKMLAGRWLKTVFGHHVDLYLLAAVLAVLSAGIIASLISRRRMRERTLPNDEILRNDEIRMTKSESNPNVQMTE